MSGICDFPHDMPDGTNSWFLKFSINDGAKDEDHLNKFYDDLGLQDVHFQHQHIVMRLFSA